MTDATATIEFCLNKYGPRCTLNEALEIVKRGRTFFYEQIEKGVYPRQVERGLWSTEALARAAVNAPMEVADEDGI